MPFTRTIMVALALAATFASPAMHAQVYPARQLRLVVPYPAGGGTDFFARVIGAQLSLQLGRQVVIEAGIDPLQSSPEEVSAYMKSETAKWAKVIGDGKITVE